MHVVSCRALHFQHGKSSRVAVATNPVSEQHSDPSSPPHISPPSPPLLPADLELRPQAGLLRGAGIRLGTEIMSKAPHSIPEQERGPAGYGCAVDRPPLLRCCH